MSIQIIKSGILDTIQDYGRYGYQHLGVNPTGAMDIFSAQLSNCLLGKDINAPVIEMHFPAAQILFEEETIICITGANFSPAINKNKIPVGQPIAINKNCILQFEKMVTGARCYLSILQNLKLDKWLNSYSTNIKAEAGGWNGRKLKKGDRINFKNNIECSGLLSNKDFILLPWGKR
ncbi:MAG: KipI antagonist, partial [Bacteroidota bacterium]|nr:KipI antagonist [Bacteroidota bacterium]